MLHRGRFLLVDMHLSTGKFMRHLTYWYFECMITSLKVKLTTTYV